LTVNAPPTAATDAETRRRIMSGYLLLILAVLMWAGNSTVGRASAGEAIPPMAFNFWRWTTALAVFTLFFGRSTWKQRHEILKHWKFVTAFSLVSVSGFNTVFYFALQKSTALQVTLIQSILPVLILLIGLAVLRERIVIRQWWGILFSIGGAALIITRGDMAVLRSLALSEGDIWALGAVFLWAWQAFLMRWKPRTIDIMPFMSAIAFIGVVVMLPLYLWENANVAPMPVTRTSILFVLYVAVMASFVGTTCWNEGTYRAGGAQAGYFGNLFPIFAGALAILILGEQPRWYHGIGAASVVIGIWLATAHHVRRPAGR
tara:strand:+ start:336 stop:1289 length:954 start_codon:yes stop_codon:yes gene_type:complete